MAKPASGKSTLKPSVRLRDVDLILENASEAYQRFTFAISGLVIMVTRNGEIEQRVELPADSPRRGRLGLVDRGGGLEFMNLYARDL
jgi:hypothetical protein